MTGDESTTASKYNVFNTADWEDDSKVAVPQPVVK